MQLDHAYCVTTEAVRGDPRERSEGLGSHTAEWISYEFD